MTSIAEPTVIVTIASTGGLEFFRLSIVGQWGIHDTAVKLANDVQGILRAHYGDLMQELPK